LGKWGVKAQGLTLRGHLRLPDSRTGEGRGIAGVVVKCVEIGRNTKGEASALVRT
jgi:hypothetical protein